MAFSCPWTAPIIWSQARFVGCIGCTCLAIDVHLDPSLLCAVRICCWEYILHVIWSRIALSWMTLSRIIAPAHRRGFRPRSLYLWSCQCEGTWACTNPNRNKYYGRRFRLPQCTPSRSYQRAQAAPSSHCSCWEPTICYPKPHTSRNGTSQLWSPRTVRSEILRPLLGTLWICWKYQFRTHGRSWTCSILLTIHSCLSRTWPGTRIRIFYPCLLLFSRSSRAVCPPSCQTNTRCCCFRRQSGLFWCQRTLIDPSYCQILF